VSDIDPTQGAEVRVRDLGKRFTVRRNEFVQALSGIDIEVSPGEFIAIVGPSGCGKSTLLRLVAGLETPDQGSVLINGDPPEKVTARHEVGIAFQDHALLPWLSVAQNIMLPARLAGQAPELAKVTELLDLVGLSDFANARPKQLSGGMRQRVAIARSLMLDPVLLLLDEPFGALDLVTRRNLNLEFQRVWANTGASTLLITHSVDEAVQLADKVYVMSASPGTIHSSFDVLLPRPRDRKLTTTLEFIELVQKISLALDEAAVDSSQRKTSA